MEHSVDLSAKIFVQTISPSSQQRILQRIKKELKLESDGDSGMFNLDDLDGRLATFDFDNDSESGEEEDGEGCKEAEIAAADSIGKALLLVKQVSLHSLIKLLCLSYCRSGLHPRLGLFLRSLACRLKYLSCSYFFGSVHAGLRSLLFLIDFYF